MEGQHATREVNENESGNRQARQVKKKIEEEEEWKKGQFIVREFLASSREYIVGFFVSIHEYVGYIMYKLPGC